jgi:hypothetical protein
MVHFLSSGIFPFPVNLSLDQQCYYNLIMAEQISVLVGNIKTRKNLQDFVTPQMTHLQSIESVLLS